MATLNNPINAQNIVDRFADYVTGPASVGIQWGTNAVPFPEFLGYTGGTTGGRGIGITGSAVSGDPINATTIYNALVTETATYTNIRKCQAKLNVTGAGGNTGTRPTAGIVYDQTQLAHLTTSYRQTLATIANGGVSSGQAISVTSLQSFFTNCASEYTAKRDTIAVIQVDVCHASCHSNCHSSRGRR